MKTKFFFASLVAAAGMLVSCNKEMTPSVQNNTEDVVPTTKVCPGLTPIVAAYIEVNDTNPLNAGDYFCENGYPFFDIV